MIRALSAAESSSHPFGGEETNAQIAPPTASTAACVEGSSSLNSSSSVDNALGGEGGGGGERVRELARGEWEGPEGLGGVRCYWGRG